MIRPALRPRVWLPRSRFRRALFGTVYLAFLGGLSWLSLKAYWSARSGVPLNEVPQIWDVYYPEMRRSGVLTADLRPDDGQFDLLMLGASVLDPAYGSIEARLNRELERLTGGRARVFSMAVSGHTSRDSRIKFERLADRPFDLVLVYHGINDVRMNNCLPGTFRDDYSHCHWYRAIQRRLKSGRLTLEMTDQLNAVHELIDLGAGDPNLWQYGRDLKTPPAFRKNLEAMIAIARKQREPLLLMTFASYIPDNYTREAFDGRKLDYEYRPDGRSCGAEMWGEPKTVAKTLAAHNEVLIDLARENTDVHFVDMAAVIPGNGKSFVDPCHLTEQGCQTFVETLTPVLKKVVGKWQSKLSLSSPTSAEKSLMR